MQQLKSVARGIDQVERARAVAMQARVAEDLDRPLACPLAQPNMPGLERGEIGDHEAVMIERPELAPDFVGDMQREVVSSRSQVDVVFVGLPVDRHAQALAIEAQRRGKALTSNEEREVTKAEGRGSLAVGHSGLIGAIQTAVHADCLPILRRGITARRAKPAHATPSGVKRVLGLALLAVLMVPACKTEPPPQDIPAMIVRALADGDSLLRNNKVDEAAKEYAWVVEQDASNAAALTGLGRVELARENPAGAIDPLKKAVAAKADDPLAQASLGRALAGTKDWAGAAEHLGKAWELDKDEDQYGLEYGVALRESKQYDEAIAVFGEVAESNPKIKYVYRELAHAHKEAGDLDKALRTYMKAQSAWAGDQDAFAGAALVYEAQGQVGKAVDQWAKYIQQDCCSSYSKETAQPKMAELKAKENAGDTAPTEG